MLRWDLYFKTNMEPIAHVGLCSALFQKRPVLEAFYKTATEKLASFPKELSPALSPILHSAMYVYQGFFLARETCFGQDVLQDSNAKTGLFFSKRAQACLIAHKGLRCDRCDKGLRWALLKESRVCKGSLACRTYPLSHILAPYRT